MAKGESLQALVKKEHARLSRARQQALTRMAAIDQQLEAIQQELKAIDAYRRVKGDSQPERARKRPTRRPRARRGEKRQAVLGLIKQHPEGVSRGEILALMGVKGNKPGEQSVSNALSALKKTNKVTSRGRKYIAA